MKDPKYIIYENLERSFGTFIIANNVLVRDKSDYQQILLFENEKYGKVLRLDKAFQTSELDEYTYHEPLVHVGMTAHPEPRDVLIIGGGDMGAMEEALKHNTVKKVTMVEIDGKVIEVAKKYLTNINKKCYENPKSRLLVKDGIKYIKETEEKFDIIILDLTDPYSISTYLYTDEFYKEVKSKLRENGILILHTEMPYVLDHIHIRVLKTLMSVFKIVRPFYNYVPIYGTVMGFAACSDHADVKKIPNEEIDKRINERGLTDLKLYNGDIHHSWLALPNRISKMLKNDNYKIITKGSAIHDYDDLNNESEDSIIKI